MGFVNYKWTEILVDSEEEFQEIAREEVKKAIIQMSKREDHNTIDHWTDKCIRVNHKTYVPVEVNTNRNGRIIYSPIMATEKPGISFRADLADYQLKIEHKKGSENILAVALSRLNLPNCDEEDMNYAEKGIVGTFLRV